jgi:hypothetical protein
VLFDGGGRLAGSGQVARRSRRTSEDEANPPRSGRGGLISGRETAN